MRIYRQTFLLTLALSLLCLQAQAKQKPNILFIAVDDLRPQILNAHIPHYRTDRMVTPNLDRLAEQGAVFDRAYCQIPVCGASRLSLLTGTRPFKAKNKNYGRFWTYHDHLDLASPSGAPAGLNRPRDREGQPAPTLPAIFKQNGYNTRSIGKIYHNSRTDDTESWTHGWTRIKDFKIYNIETIQSAYEIGTGMDDADYADGKNKNEALDALRSLSRDEKPFFLALGFAKPHLPFNCPQKYWDLYDRKDIKLADNPLAPTAAPRESLHNWGELRGYENLIFKDEAKTTLDDAYARTLIHGYYACVSYADAMIGAVLDELERLKLRDNTVVVLWGDHGWNLGEHNLWCKHCLYETSLLVPLYLDVPGYRNGVRSRALVEYVDIYPTLCDVAGIPLPDHLQGTSMVPLLNQPDRPWKGAVFSNWQRGKSVRTDRYRYSEFYSTGDKQLSCMLYDHQTDPMETVNIADHADKQPLIQTLSRLLNDGWPRAAQLDNRTPIPFDIKPDGSVSKNATSIN
jgi:arylsulfatase A-like enzyme